MSYRETLFASLELKKPQVAPKIKTVRISKAPYLPNANPASPRAGVSAWFFLGGRGRWASRPWKDPRPAPANEGSIGSHNHYPYAIDLISQAGARGNNLR